MTMMSFRVDEDEAIRTQRWAEAIGVERSELLRDALHRHLAQLDAEHDIRTWIDQPLSEPESTLAEIAGWGPAEDWSDWIDAVG
ncbi:MAG: CopG family transcriptional regulator [Ilumatobacteraceae bacterium]